MWAHILNMLAGIWLMAAPAVLKYDGAARINDRITGPLAATFACIAIWEITRPCRWVCTLCGIWLLLAPWVLPGYSGIVTLNSMSSGAIIAALSLVRGRYDPAKFGGGWKPLFTTPRQPQPQS